jgi:hypothetical protein
VPIAVLHSGATEPAAQPADAGPVRPHETSAVLHFGEHRYLVHFSAVVLRVRIPGHKILSRISILERGYNRDDKCRG